MIAKFHCVQAMELLEALDIGHQRYGELITQSIRLRFIKFASTLNVLCSLA